MAVVARNGSMSRWTRLKMYSNAVCSRLCWSRWSTMWPPKPAPAATSTSGAHQSGENRRERQDQSAQPARPQSPA